MSASWRLLSVQPILSPTVLHRFVVKCHEIYGPIMQQPNSQILSKYGLKQCSSDGNASAIRAEYVLPCVCYHGTSENALKNIRNDGILAAGDINSSGEVINMIHGAVYGDGVYLSPDPRLAASYGHRDINGTVTFMAALTAPGRMKELKNERTTPRVIYDQDRNVKIKAPKSKPSPSPSPSHCSVTSDGLQYIFVNSDQVLPLFLVTVTPSSSTVTIDSDGDMSSFSNFSLRAKPAPSNFVRSYLKSLTTIRKNILEHEEKDITFENDRSDASRTFYRMYQVPGQELLWCLKINSHNIDIFTDKKIDISCFKSRIFVYYVVDAYRGGDDDDDDSYIKMSVPCIENMNNAILPDKSIAIISCRTDDVRCVPLDSPVAYREMRKIVREDSTDVLEALSEAVKIAATNHNNAMDQFEQQHVCIECSRMF